MHDKYLIVLCEAVIDRLSVGHDLILEDHNALHSFPHFLPLEKCMADFERLVLIETSNCTK